MIKKFFNSQTKNITLATFVLGTAYLVSVFLGFLRDRLLASRFGAGDVLDVYYAAFRIPDFVAMVLIMGAISAAITPIFSENLLRSKKDSWRYLSNTLNFFLISLVVICGILFVFTPALISLIAPGFSGEKKELTILLTRIMFFSPIFLGISNVISAILQVFRRFLITSLSPIMYNLGIIFGIIFLLPQMGIKGLAWGVVLGGFLHLLIQLPIIFRIGFKPQKILNIRDLSLIKTVKLTIPRSLGLLASQVNLIAITAIASGLVSGSIAIFSLANNLSQPLISLIAVPFSTVAFPFLTLSFAKKNKVEFIQRFSSTFRKIIFLLIPLSILLFILKTQIVKIVLAAGRFGEVDVKLTAASLGLFCLGLFAYGLTLLLSKSFYAIQNTKIPAILSIFTMMINIGLAFLFLWLLKFPNIFQEGVINFFKLGGIKNIAILSLPLAFSLAGIFQFFLLFFLLQKKIGDFGLKEIFNSFLKISLSSLIMTTGVFLSLKLISPLLKIQTFLGVLSQTLIVFLFGVLIYILATLFLNSPETNFLKIWIAKKFPNKTQ